MAEQQTYIEQLRERKLVLATEKDETHIAAIGLLHLYKNRVIKFEPEKAHRRDNGEQFPAQQEPKSDDSLKPTRFKIERALDFYKDKGETLTIMAADVVFKMKRWGSSEKTTTYHQMARLMNAEPTSDRNSLDYNQYLANLEELWNRYCVEPFTAQWEVTFGLYDEGKTEYVTVFIESDFTNPLAHMQVIKQYNTRSNAGINLLEIANNFVLKFNPEDPGIRIDAELADRLIVKKVPTEGMVGRLMNAEIGQHQERYGLIGQGLAHSA
jgi:hypothetical protein